MENLNTNRTVENSQTDRVIELVRSMDIENKRILLKFADAMVGTQPGISPYVHLTATLHVLPTGELVTVDIEFYRNTKARVILTHAEAKALRAELDDALGKTAFTILQRQQDAMGAQP